MKPNLACLVEIGRWYPVAYTIKQSGERVYGATLLQGADLTAPQIEALYQGGWL